MAIFDTFIDDVESQYGLGPDAGPIACRRISAKTGC